MIGSILTTLGINRERIEGIVRHGLTVAGGALIATGVVDESSWMEIVGAVSTVVGVLWSILSKKF